MKNRIVLGQSSSGSLTLDLPVFLRTRMLVQAASGQGKSHWLRRLCESLFGKVQIFIIDHEGEFSSLRPEYDFAVIGEGGDAPADVRSAALLAQKLLEMNASAVFDLSESFRKHPRDRHTWVKNFLLSMMEAPKRLWHPVVVIVDEAHKFAPEKDESEALDSMVSLATDGRKREFCAVYATQRLGKLAKDAASELLNVMIGGTVLDIDRKRAADALGVYGPELRPFNDEIKTIERGNFWCLGPALARERVLVKIGETKTHPPKLGSSAALEPPPPTAKIRALLPQLADLPKVAEDKARTEAELRAEIRDLKGKLRTAPTPVSRPDSRLEEKLHKASATATESQKQAQALHSQLKSITVKGARLSNDMAVLAKSAAALFNTKVPDVPATKFEIPKEPITRLVLPPSRRDVARSEEPNELNGPELKILTALSQLLSIDKTAPTKAMVAGWAGYSAQGGAFGNPIGALRTKGLVEYPSPGVVSITEEGLAKVGVQSAPDEREMQQRILNICSGPERKILTALLEHGQEEISKADLAERSGYQLEGGAFGNPIGALRTKGFLDYPRPGVVKAAEWLFRE